MFGLRRAVPLQKDSPAYRIAVGRTLIASSILAAPVLAMRVVGADSATAARVTWLTRMMAIRDGSLGAGALLAARRGDDASGWVLAGAVSDAVDAVVVANAIRQGRLRGPLPVGVAVGAAGVAGAGVVAALTARR